MKEEEQVTNLDTSKKLKDLGVKQDSLFYWGKDHEGARLFSNKTYKDYSAAEYLDKKKLFYKALDGSNDIYEDFIKGSAFTVSELGLILPMELEMDEGMRFDLNIWKNEIGWSVSYWWDEDSRRLGNDNNFVIADKTLANAMGRVLIYLIEKEMLSPLK